MRTRSWALLVPLLLLLLGSGPLRAQPARDPEVEARRQARFTELLRTYPERAPELTLGEVAKLVDQGPFAERERAVYWIGSARLARGDRAGARMWFAKLRREHAGSVWVERSHLGMADAAAAERRFGEALAWQAQAMGARDPAVRELARLSSLQVLTLRHRQWAAWAAMAYGLLVAFGLLVAVLRQRGPGGLWPLPVEARIALPVLVVLALLSLRQDPAPRGAVWELCGAGFVLSFLSGARVSTGLSRGQRLAQALVVLAAFAGWAYVAVWRADLVGMVQETWRAGPE